MSKRMITLNFPTLEFIKSHKRHPNPKDKEYFEEYEWTIFDIPGSPIYCRITYNEEDNGKLYLDMMVNGYSDHWVPDGFGETYPATISGYTALQEATNKTINEMFENIIDTNKDFSKEWE